MIENTTLNGIKLALRAVVAVTAMIAIAGVLTYVGPLLAKLLG